MPTIREHLEHTKNQRKLLKKMLHDYFKQHAGHTLSPFLRACAKECDQTNDIRQSGYDSNGGMNPPKYLLELERNAVQKYGAIALVLRDSGHLSTEAGRGLTELFAQYEESYVASLVNTPLYRDLMLEAKAPAIARTLETQRIKFVELEKGLLDFLAERITQENSKGFLMFGKNSDAIAKLKGYKKELENIDIQTDGGKCKLMQVAMRIQRDYPTASINNFPQNISPDQWNLLYSLSAAHAPSQTQSARATAQPDDLSDWDTVAKDDTRPAGHRQAQAENPGEEMQEKNTPGGLAPK